MAPTRFSSGLSLWSFSFRPPMGYSACLYRRVSYPTGMPACQPSLPNAERNLRNRPEVRVTRSTAKSADRYRKAVEAVLEYSGEDIESNLSLVEKMRRDFGLELPLLEEDDTPEGYFKKFAEILKIKRRWSIRQQITVA